MNPSSLFLAIAIGVGAVVAVGAVAAGLWRLRRTWPAAADAYPLPALRWLLVGAVILYVADRVRAWPSGGWWITPIEPGGWQRYYVVVIGSFLLAYLLALVLVVVNAIAVLMSVHVWLDRPVGPDWGDVTNGQRLRRIWRIRRRERRIARHLAAQLAAAGGHQRGAVELSRAVLPEGATTMFKITWTDRCTILTFTEELSGDPAVRSVLPDYQADGLWLRVEWNVHYLDQRGRVSRAGYFCLENGVNHQSAPVGRFEIRAPRRVAATLPLRRNGRRHA